MRGAPAPPGGAHSWHLLVVEDDPALRALVVELLTEGGYRAHGAPDGATALALLARPGAPPVGAILLDLHLPDMDGPAFAAAYRRRRGAAAPLLVFTGAPPAEAAAADRLGAVGVVPKPFDLDALLATVGRCLPAPGPPALGPPGPAAPPAPEARAAPPATPAWEPEPRRRQLTRLGAEVARVRAATARVQAEVRALAAAEAARTLTPAEARRVPALRREAEALRLELARFAREFAGLCATGAARRARGPA